MFRLGLVLLTTAALLVCPYGCAVRSSMAAIQAEAKHGCSCCTQKCSTSQAFGNETQNEAPSPLTEGEDSCNCICDGAVSTPTVSIIAISPSWMDCLDLTVQVRVYRSEQVVFDNVPPSGIESGLCPRLSMQSLLL